MFFQVNEEKSMQRLAHRKDMTSGCVITTMTMIIIMMIPTTTPLLK